MPILLNSIALTSNVFTELANTVMYRGGGCSASNHSKGFLVTPLRFTEFA